MNPGQLTLLGSTICVMLTTHFSVQLLSEHFFYWKKPKEQKAIIIIILMAPVYALDSYVGLLDYEGSKVFFAFLDSVKECYEALVRTWYFKSHTPIHLSTLITPSQYAALLEEDLCRWWSYLDELNVCAYHVQVIAKFLALLYSYLNISISKNIVPDEIKGREIHHSFPMTLFQVEFIHMFSAWVTLWMSATPHGYMLHFQEHLVWLGKFTSVDGKCMLFNRHSVLLDVYVSVLRNLLEI